MKHLCSVQDTALELDKLKKEKPEAFYFIKGYIQRAAEENINTEDKEEPNLCYQNMI